MAKQQCCRALGLALAASLAAWAVQAYSLPLRERLFAALVRDRAQAIEAAFGQTFVPHVTDLRILVLDRDEWAKAGLSGITAYVPESKTLYVSRRLLSSLAPPSTVSTRQYWPWHEEPLRIVYPVVEVIDGALWTTLLQESAHERSLRNRRRNRKRNRKER